MSYNPDTPIFQLTVSEFENLIRKNIGLTPEPTQNPEVPKKQYVYGLKGLAKLLNCSVSHASHLKSTGVFKDAIIQRDRKLVINAELALKYFNERD